MQMAAVDSRVKLRLLTPNVILVTIARWRREQCKILRRPTNDYIVERRATVHSTPWCKN